MLDLNRALALIEGFGNLGNSASHLGAALGHENHRNRHEFCPGSASATRSTSFVTRGWPSKEAATPPMTAAGTLACLSHAVVAAIA